MEENLTIQERWNKIPNLEKAKMMFLVKKSREQIPQGNKKNILNMNKLIVKIILAIAIGVLVGTVSGNLESNKKVTYFNNGNEISKDTYDKYNEDDNLYALPLNKKVFFNKEVGFYYGAITGAFLIVLLLIPSLIKKQDD